jgi:hypothetical protein
MPQISCTPIFPLPTCSQPGSPVSSLPLLKRPPMPLQPEGPCPQLTHRPLKRTHRLTHAHTFACTWKGAAPGRRPPGALSSWGRSPGPAGSSFSPLLFLTQPPTPQPQRKLHNLLGAANVAEDYSQHREAHSGRPRTTPPQTYQGRPAPISPASCSRPRTRSAPQMEPLTTAPPQPGLKGPKIERERWRDKNFTGIRIPPGLAQSTPNPRLFQPRPERPTVPLTGHTLALGLTIAPTP